MSRFEMQTTDLKGLKERFSIQLLRVEVLEMPQYPPSPLVRVRYARDGVEQKSGFPMDLGKGIFIATLEDDELNGISRDELEESLREAAAEIIKIVRRDNIPRTLQTLLAYEDYLEYDEGGSEPPHLLRCFKGTNLQFPHQAPNLFEIAQGLSALSGEHYRVESYGASYPNDDKPETEWHECAFRATGRHCNGTPAALPPKVLAEASQKAVATLIHRRSETPPLLQTLLKDYAHLAYDARHSHPPNFLKCQVTAPEHPRHEREIFEIADALSTKTGKAYRVAAYGGTHLDDKGFDEAWTHFALKVVNIGT